MASPCRRLRAALADENAPRLPRTLPVDVWADTGPIKFGGERACMIGPAEPTRLTVMMITAGWEISSNLLRTLWLRALATEETARAVLPPLRGRW